MGIIARQSIRGTAVTYLGVLIGFVTTFFILTRFLTAEEIGLARVLTDTAGIFIALAQLGTNSSIIRFYPYFKDKEKGDHGFFFWTLVIPFAGFAVFAFLYWALHVPLQQLFAEKSPLFVDYYYFVLPMAFFMLYQTTFETGANVLMRIVVPRAVREVVTRILLLAVYLLYAFRVISIDGFVIALCSVYALAALCNLVYLCSLGHISLRPDFAYLDRKLVRSWALYSSFLLLSAMAGILAPSLSSFFVTTRMGLDQTGIFAIANYIAVMVSIPYRSVCAITQPEIAQASKDSNRQQTGRLLKQVANNMLLTGTLILCLIWVNIDLIFHLLPNGSTYATARTAVLLLGLSHLIQGTFSITVSALNYSRHYYWSLLLSVLLTLAAVFLNNSLIPLFGMEGAAAASLLAYAGYTILLLVAVKLITKTGPLSGNLLKTCLIGVLILGGNALWTRAAGDVNIWISSIARTVVLVGGGALLAYVWHISEDINSLLRTYLHQAARLFRKH